MTLEPNWTSPPGATIARLLAIREVMPEELADSLGLEIEEFDELIEGRKRITIEIAEALAENLGSSARFWLARDRNFIKEAARLGNAGHDEAKDWVASMPVRAMRRFGWLTASAKGNDLHNELLSYFDCGSLREWGARYSTGIGAVAFRTSLAFPEDGMATLVWLRAGDRLLRELKLRQFDRTAFTHLLPALKKYSAYKHPKTIIERLQIACSEVGVAVTTARAPEGCRASGASWFSASGNPVIHLSFRHMAEDHFWFTFFHEAGHVILHGQSHIDGENATALAAGEPEHEMEANSFAEELLIASELRQELVVNRVTKSRIMAVARQANVTPGIIVGQLERLGKIEHGKLSFLKRRYRWSDNPYIPELKA